MGRKAMGRKARTMRGNQGRVGSNGARVVSSQAGTAINEATRASALRSGKVGRERQQGINSRVLAPFC